MKSSTNNKINFYRDEYGKHSTKAPFMNQFATFTWRDKHSWEDFGCFIINKGSDLKWIGTTTQNNYSAPLFGGNSQTITSTTFDGAKIKLNLGLYGVTAAEYGAFIAWMNPLVIDRLFFQYNTDYYYIVKPSSISEATKNVIGYLSTDEPVYYVETNVTFELQGELCGWNKNINRWTTAPLDSKHCWIRNNLDQLYRYCYNHISDLRNSFKIQFKLSAMTSSSKDKHIVVKIAPIEYKKDKERWEWDEASSLLLLDMRRNDKDTEAMSFVYDSADGLVYDTADKKLITLSSNKIVSLLARKLLLPSWLEDRNFYTDWSDNIRNRDIAIEILGGDGSAAEELWPLESSYINIYDNLKTPII